MSQEPNVSIPRVVDGTDVRSLPIGPHEGFVLSRIDGAVSLAEISDLTGLPSEMVQQTVDKLVELGAVEWAPPAREPRTSHRPAQPTPSGGMVRTRPPPPGTSRSLYDPAELEEDVDLDMERRRLVLDTYYRLDELDHYRLLGVEPTADKAEIRNAYFKLSKIFHPDTLYGKRLGSYQHKMELVFGRLTEAYDILGKKKNRQEYDEYLRLVQQTRDAQSLIEETRREAEAIERGEPVAEAEPISTDDSAAPEAAEPPLQPPSEPSAPSSPARSRPTSERTRQARRQLHARRLAAATGRPVPGGKPPRRSSRAAGGSSGPPAGDPPAAPASRQQRLRGLASSLKQTAGVTGGVEPAERRLAEARRAEQSGNLIDATNAVRLAIAIAPDREDLQREHDRLKTLLAKTLADTYAKQATYEERQGKWAAAALSWSKVADGRPDDADPARRAANAILKARGDLKKAKSLAQRAVDLRPEDARTRRELGRVFVEAGMKLNARRELEQAAKLDPRDEMVKNLLGELKETD